MSILDDVVDLFKDGEWHSLKDVAKNLKLTQQELQEILRFLKSLGLVKLDEKQEKGLMTSVLRELISIEA
jgi:Mn-dependent DtxR family transcriptional regulator